jgi:hypothetical protein
MYTKTMLAAATLVAVAVSSPALAKTTHKTHKTTHHVSHNEVRPVDAYAAAYPNVRTGQDPARTMSMTFAVVTSGGSDATVACSRDPAGD